MNNKLANTLRALLVMGVMSSIGFSVIASPVTVEVKSKIQIVEQSGSYHIGYIEDEIVSINKKAKTVTIGDAKDVKSQIVVKINDQTAISHAKNRRVYKFSDLEVGQKIGIESNGMVAKGQLRAIKITVLEEVSKPEEKLATCPVAGYIQDEIVSINKQVKTVTIGDAKDTGSQIVVKIDNQTRIAHTKNRRAYRFEDLQVGQKIAMESNGIMVNGQVNAIGITIF